MGPCWSPAASAPGGSTVTFSSPLGRLIAPAIAASATELVVRVPEGATTGPIGASTARGTAVSATSFLVTGSPLRIQITSPTEGAVLPTTRVQVTGTLDLSTATVGVSVNGVPASVNGAQWAAEVPLVAGSNTLTAIATDTLGTTATAQISVQVPQPQEAAVLLTASPGSGVAPLTVTWQVVNQTGRSLVLFEFDPTGTATFGSPTFEVTPTTYSAPGLFFPTLRATDDQGITYTARTSVNVEDPQIVTARLQAQWSGLKARLQAGDIAGALSYLTPGLQGRLQPLFQQLGAALPQVAASLGDLTVLSQVEDLAEGVLVQPENGTPYLYFIYFRRDSLGRWLIEEL